MRSDIEHLKLLAIFHYIAAPLALLLAIFPLIYAVMGMIFVFNLPTQAGVIYGWVFVGVGGSLALLLSVSAVLFVLAGRGLQLQRNRPLCFTAAILLCLGLVFILPTILGIFTIVVLCRPTVRDLFAGRAVVRDPEDEDDPLPSAMLGSRS